MVTGNSKSVVTHINRGADFAVKHQKKVHKMSEVDLTPLWYV